MTTTDTSTHITDVGTVGVPVSDQDRALEVYRDKLGFETRMDGSFGEGMRWIEVAPPLTDGAVAGAGLAVAWAGAATAQNAVPPIGG